MSLGFPLVEELRDQREERFVAGFWEEMRSACWSKMRWRVDSAESGLRLGDSGLVVESESEVGWWVRIWAVVGSLVMESESRAVLVPVEVIRAEEGGFSPFFLLGSGVDMVSIVTRLGE